MEYYKFDLKTKLIILIILNMEELYETENNIYTATKVFLEENNLVGIHVVLLKLKRNSWPLYELMKFKKRATYCTLFTRRTATIRKH